MLKLFRAVLTVAALICPLSNSGAQAPDRAADWNSFLGNNAGWSYSPLDQINRQNVANLAQVWSLPIGGNVQNSAPVVVDGVMYMVMGDERILALDAATGKVKWAYGTPGPGLRGQRGSASVAVGSGMVYYGKMDNHLVALDAATGHEVWDVEIENRSCNCQPSLGILIAGDKVIVGVRGDVGHRSYINAFDAKTGRHKWRWWVIPGPGEPGHETWPEYLWKLGGGATWHSGTYDPKLNLIYWGTGNPQPLTGDTSPQTKLWTNSLVALDANTGKLRWGFQETPADPFDYDFATEPILIDAPVNGKMTPLVVHTVKSGYTYVFNRATGAVVSTYAHADHISWAKGVSPAGKAIEPLRAVKGQSMTVCPTFYGSRAANHGAFSPKTGLWYGGSAEFCTKFTPIDPGRLVEGRPINAGRNEGVMRAPGKPFIGAFDPVSGKRAWTMATEVPNYSSLIATGGNLVFGSDLFGDIWALDAETGNRLWSAKLGAQNANSAVSYAVNGKQYIAIATGGGGYSTASIRELWPEEAKRFPPAGNTLIIFALRGEDGK